MSETRRAPPVDPGWVARAHKALAGIVVDMPAGEADTVRLRRLYATIRTHRNKAQRLLGALLQILGGLKADRERVARIVEKATAAAVNDGTAPGRPGFLGCRTSADRTARVKVLVSDDLDALASIEEDVALVAECVGHARGVIAELQAAFEEASRTMASIELDWKIARNE